MKGVLLRQRLLGEWIPSICAAMPALYLAGPASLREETGLYLCEQQHPVVPRYPNHVRPPMERFCVPCVVVHMAKIVLCFTLHGHVGVLRWRE